MTYRYRGWIYIVHGRWIRDGCCTVFWDSKRKSADPNAFWSVWIRQPDGSRTEEHELYVRQEKRKSGRRVEIVGTREELGIPEPAFVPKQGRLI